MSDEEVICDFVEPLATIDCAAGGKRSLADWWRRETAWSDTLVWKPWVPARLTLDALWKVEDRLSEQQRRHYCVLIFHAVCTEARTSNLIEDTMTKNRWPMIHASAAQKIKALAAVLRVAVRNA